MNPFLIRRDLRRVRERLAYLERREPTCGSCSHARIWAGARMVCVNPDCGSVHFQALEIARGRAAHREAVAAFERRRG